MKTILAAIGVAALIWTYAFLISSIPSLRTVDNQVYLGSCFGLLAAVLVRAAFRVRRPSILLWCVVGFAGWCLAAWVSAHYTELRFSGGGREWPAWYASFPSSYLYLSEHLVAGLVAGAAASLPLLGVERGARLGAVGNAAMVTGAGGLTWVWVFHGIWAN